MKRTEAAKGRGMLPRPREEKGKAKEERAKAKEEKTVSSIAKGCILGKRSQKMKPVP